MRYSRQEAFSGLGHGSQQRLNASVVTIVGVGALGTRVAELLCRAGVGKLILIDFDKVELSNLQRQTLFTESDVGISKVEAAADRLRQINSEIEIVSFDKKLAFDVVDGFIIDCTDSLEIAFMINDFCVKSKRAFIHGSAAGSRGTLYCYAADRPCLRCFIPAAKNPETAATSGILNTAVSMVATLQANEAIKHIVGKEMEKSYLRMDVWNNSFDRISVRKKKTCICSQ
ncbi:hypothetical protein COV93_03435 [Candidatus Woesearchaeota archaeon CG11_big_fil_rev_8_21_14_0_20_43_8]|nr:MAG: hypothetical protein COV93_03435 [Candidatus Woesearchaeota archaeon CG11_big_fil_rev_8_21_14_0_20_43_8]